MQTVSRAMQALYVYNDGVPSCIMYGVFDERPFNEIPDEELLNTDIFPLSYEEAMELEEIDRFNEEIERQRNMIEEEMIDYEEEMENMAFLYDMREILNLANDLDRQDQVKSERKEKELQQQQMMYHLSKSNKTRSNRTMKNSNSTNYRKPKKLLHQPRSRHLFVRGTRSN